MKHFGDCNSDIKILALRGSTIFTENRYQQTISGG
jgi:hypothetical protein